MHNRASRVPFVICLAGTSRDGRRSRLGRVTRLYLAAQFFHALAQFFDLTFGVGKFRSGLLQLLAQLRNIGTGRSRILCQRTGGKGAHEGADNLERHCH